MDYQIKLKYVNWQKDIFEDVNGRKITRGKAISIFVQKGLLPLLYKNGYTLTKNTLQMEDTIASMMFKYSLNKNVIYCVSDINTTEEMREHYDYFCNVLNYEIWDRFWKKWNTLFDNMFHYEESFGAQIEYMIWECIDLKKSPTYLEYLEESYESDENNVKSNEDPYILDNLNRYETII